MKLRTKGSSPVFPFGILGILIAGLCFSNLANSAEGDFPSKGHDPLTSAKSIEKLPFNYMTGESKNRPHHKTCPVNAGPGLRYEDFAGQIVREFDSIVARNAVRDKAFGEERAIWQQDEDITPIIKRLILPGAKKSQVLPLLEATFGFQSGIPWDVIAPEEADDVRCGYCRPADTQHLYDEKFNSRFPDPGFDHRHGLSSYFYRICLFFREDHLLDLKAEGFDPDKRHYEEQLRNSKKN
jgi:hypothetical protein